MFEVYQPVSYSIAMVASPKQYVTLTADLARHRYTTLFFSLASTA
jgi:hypothetical protein